MGCHAEVIGIAVCLDGAVRGPSAPRLAIHVWIRAPAHTQVQTVSHHLSAEIVLKPIHRVCALQKRTTQKKKKSKSYSRTMGRRQTCTHGAMLFLSSTGKSTRPHPRGCSLRTADGFERMRFENVRRQMENEGTVHCICYPVFVIQLYWSQVWMFQALFLSLFLLKSLICWPARQTNLQQVFEAYNQLRLKYELD